MSDSEKKTRKSHVLPDRNFISTTALWQGDLLPCQDLFRDHGFADSVLSNTPLERCGWATLYAYMHRRFGPPHVGGDGDKDFSASWMLTTPDSEVFLSVNPSLSGPDSSFSLYLLKPADSSKTICRARDLQLSEQRISAIRCAYRDALLDLLRPVCIRNDQINAMGELGDKALDVALTEWDEESESEVYAVQPHPSSGFGMPPGLFGGEQWATFCSLIRRLGNGDMGKGRSEVVQLLQKQIFLEASLEQWAVHRLMLLGAGKFQKDVAAGLGLDEQAVSRFACEMKALRDGDTPDYSFVEEMTDGAITKATHFLSNLGFGGCDIMYIVGGIRRKKASAEAWEDFLSVTQGSFPDDVTLPSSPHVLANELPLRLKQIFNGIDRADLSSWVDRTWARIEGPSALADITFYISEKIKKAPPVQRSPGM